MLRLCLLKLGMLLFHHTTNRPTRPETDYCASTLYNQKCQGPKPVTVRQTGGCNSNCQDTLSYRNRLYLQVLSWEKYLFSNRRQKTRSCAVVYFRSELAEVGNLEEGFTFVKSAWTILLAALGSSVKKFAVILDVAINHLAFGSWIQYPRQKALLLYHFCANIDRGVRIFEGLKVLGVDCRSKWTGATEKPARLVVQT